MEKELIKNLEIITQMMREYAKRNHYPYGIYCKIFDDGSWRIGSTGSIVASASLPELIDKLKK